MLRKLFQICGLLSLVFLISCSNDNIVKSGVVKEYQVKIPVTYDELLVKTNDNINSCSYVIIYDDFLQDDKNNYLLKDPNMFKNIILAYDNNEFIIIKKDDNTEIITYKPSNDEYFYNLGDDLIIDGNYNIIKYKLKYNLNVDKDTQFNYTEKPQEKEIKIIEANKIIVKEGQFSF